jgi:hypothetical protein
MKIFFIGVRFSEISNHIIQFAQIYINLKLRQMTTRWITNAKCVHKLIVNEVCIPREYILHEYGIA